MKKNDENREYIERPIEVTDTIERQSFKLMRFVGYVILGFSVIDYVGILLPLRLVDPVWELQTIGQLVEHVAGPLIGFVLVFFYTRNNLVGLVEKTWLKFLSWAALILGVAYLLMLPLALNNSIMLYDGVSAQINNQQQQMSEQLEKLNQQLDKATTPEEIGAIDKILNPQRKAQANESPTLLKGDLKQQIQRVNKNVATAADEALSGKKFQVIKDTVKVVLGTLLAGVSLIIVWRVTEWARFIQNAY